MKSKIETSVCKKCGSDMGCSHKTNKIEEDTKDTAEFTKGFHSGYQDRDKEVKKVIDEIEHVTINLGNPEYTKGYNTGWKECKGEIKQKLRLK